MQWATNFREVYKAVMAKKSPPRANSRKAKKTPKVAQPLSRVEQIKKRRADFLARRPHRSFQRTYRRDYVRSLMLPGYVSFTLEVMRMLMKNKRTFGLLILLYAGFSALMIGLTAQSNYTELRNILDETGKNLFSGAWGQITQAGLLAVSVVSTATSPRLTDVQQVYAGFIFLFTWLTTVWILRAQLAGQVVKLRDALYNSGSPALSTLMLMIVSMVQLVPVAIAVIGFSAANSTGMLEFGLFSMLFWIIASLLGVISLYWLTSTLMAMVVVTLPGMYPMQALRTAGDMVVGRRIRILLRLAWAGLLIGVGWFLVVVPTILFEGLLHSVKWLDWLTITPMVILLLTSASTVWLASYIYLLYRKVVDDDAKPA